MNELSRRRMMLAAASTGAIAVSGCLSEAGDGPSDEGETDTNGGNGENGGNGNGDDTNADDGDDGDNGDDGDGDGEESDVPELVDSSIETTDTDCGSPEDADVAVTLEEGTVTITGTTPAPNPCHEAVLEEATLDSGRLSLVIDVEDATADDESCAQCHGIVEYVVRIEPDDAAAVDTVDVEHVAGDTHTVDEDEFGTGDETRFELGSSSIETVDTGCSSGDDDTISVDPGDETITIDGVLPASTPCYEAVLEDVTLEDDTLSLVVDVRSTLEEGEACSDCVGRVEYEAPIEVTNAAELGSVHVDHVTGGSHAAGWESASETTRGDE